MKIGELYFFSFGSSHTFKVALRTRLASEIILLWKTITMPTAIFWPTMRIKAAKHCENDWTLRTVTPQGQK